MKDIPLHYASNVPLILFQDDSHQTGPIGQEDSVRFYPDKISWLDVISHYEYLCRKYAFFEPMALTFLTKKCIMI